jgi:hypothetical protein
MECPTCRADIDLNLIDIFDHEDGVEFSFDCPACGGAFARALTPEEFEVVDPL